MGDAQLHINNWLLDHSTKTAGWTILHRGEVSHFDTINNVAEFIASGSTDREICEVVSAILSAIAVKVRDEDCVRCGPSPFDAADARLIDRLADDIDRVALIAGGMADRIKWNP